MAPESLLLLLPLLVLAAMADSLAFAVPGVVPVVTLPRLSWRPCCCGQMTLRKTSSHSWKWRAGHRGIEACP
jgi:hypothetical protein